ncbi:MAG: hypothetical protein QOH76_660 [Thermoleophilaceae bacterium]|nr:hypothetical protein [Thermoleophilaceae bacterium]
MRPEEIGDLLGTDPESVIVAREGALEQLATQLDMDDVSELDQVRTRLAELPADAWTGTAPTENGDEPAPERLPKLAVVSENREEREPRAEARERRSRLPILLALLAAAAIALVVVLASSGGDEGTGGGPAPAGQAKKASKPAASKPAAAQQKVTLAALGGNAGATGTAALTDGGKRLRLDVSGLPNPHGGAYQVWLYDSVIDAMSLVKVSDTKLGLDLKLPKNASHYRYVDISREPDDGNPNHSGESVLRVPLAKLSG